MIATGELNRQRLAAHDLPIPHLSYYKNAQYHLEMEIAPVSRGCTARTGPLAPTSHSSSAPVASAFAASAFVSAGSGSADPAAQLLLRDFAAT